MKTIYDDRYRRAMRYLSEERKRKGMTQSTVAGRMDKSRAWFGKVECCEVRCDVLQFIRLCRIIGVDVMKMIRQMAEESSEEDDSFFTFDIDSKKETVYYFLRWKGHGRGVFKSCVNPCRHTIVSAPLDGPTNGHSIPVVHPYSLVRAHERICRLCDKKAVKCAKSKAYRSLTTCTP